MLFVISYVLVRAWFHYHSVMVNYDVTGLDETRAVADIQANSGSACRLQNVHRWLSTFTGPQGRHRCHHCY